MYTLVETGIVQKVVVALAAGVGIFLGSPEDEDTTNPLLSPD
jgi:hypothetical protein